MAELTVYHESIYGNGERTVFGGDDLDYRIEDSGALRIIKWQTASDHRGDALFAPGKWIGVIRDVSRTGY